MATKEGDFIDLFPFPVPSYSLVDEHRFGFGSDDYSVPVPMRADREERCFFKEKTQPDPAPFRS
jgi:hypothetical protein